MKWKNLLIGALLLLGLLGTAAACGDARPTAHVDLEGLAGCTRVRVEGAVHERTTIVLVTVADCRGTGGIHLAHAAAVERIARAVWESLRRPVDVVRIDLPDGDPGREPVDLLGDDLGQRFELGRATSVVSVPDRLADAIWLLLPAGYVVAAVLVVAATRRLRRSGATLVVLRW